MVFFNHLIGDGSNQLYNLEYCELTHYSFHDSAVDAAGFKRLRWCQSIRRWIWSLLKRASTTDRYIAMLGCLENCFIHVLQATHWNHKWNTSCRLRRWPNDLQVKKLYTRTDWKMEVPKWEGLTRNLPISWMSSNADTWQPKAILCLRMKKYYEHKNCLFNSAVSSSTAPKHRKQGHFWFQ